MTLRLGSGQAHAEVIGHPIAHSKSPLIHRFWLNRLGIVADYHSRDILPDDLAGYFAKAARDPDWRGCNITIPHKVAALDHVNDPGDVRLSIGAITSAPTPTPPAFTRRLPICPWLVKRQLSSARAARPVRCFLLWRAPI
jgi:hypothetical protein